MTEFGEFVFKNKLTTFEALSKLDVIEVGQEVLDLRAELNSVRDQLFQLSIDYSNTKSLVSTLEIKIVDLQFKISQYDDKIDLALANSTSAEKNATEAKALIVEFKNEVQPKLTKLTSDVVSVNNKIDATDAKVIALDTKVAKNTTDITQASMVKGRVPVTITAARNKGNLKETIQFSGTFQMEGLVLYNETYFFDNGTKKIRVRIELPWENKVGEPVTWGYCKLYSVEDGYYDQAFIVKNK